MFLEQEMMNLHDPLDALMVHPRLPSLGKGPVDKGGDPPVSIGRTIVNNHPDQGNVSCIIRPYLVPSGSCWLFVEV